MRDGWEQPGYERRSQGAASDEWSATARLLVLEEGLFAVTMAEMAPPGGSAGGLPMVLLASPPSALYDRSDILAAWDEQGGWIGPAGGAVVVRAPPGGGLVLATLYQSPDRPSEIDIDQLEVGRIDRGFGKPLQESRASGAAGQEEPFGEAAFQDDPDADDAPASELHEASPRLAEEPPEAAEDLSEPPEEPLESAGDPSDVPIKLLLHIEDEGDRTCGGGAWGGVIGQQLRVEGISIRPSGPLTEDAIRYMAFGPGGRETRWMSGGQLCGARGRGVPLTGFVVELLGDEAERYSVVYQGAFFLSGVTPPCTDGTPCLPLYPDDHLEAVNVRIVPRGVG